jgi:hypothetical protein
VLEIGNGNFKEWESSLKVFENEMKFSIFAAVKNGII